MAKKQRPGRKRNPVAHHLFMHRGGVHEKSNSAKRQENKRELRAMLAKKGGGFSAPSFFHASNIRYLCAGVTRRSSVKRTVSVF